MLIPRSFADGKTDLAPMVWDLMTRGEFQGFEGCAPTRGLREYLLVCMLTRAKMFFHLDERAPWPRGGDANEKAQA
jgi:hypothetical protein